MAAVGLAVPGVLHSNEHSDDDCGSVHEGVLTPTGLEVPEQVRDGSARLEPSDGQEAPEGRKFEVPTASVACLCGCVMFVAMAVKL